MNDLKNESFYLNLSYPTKKLTENIIELNLKKQKIFYITTIFMIALFLISAIFINRYKSNEFLILCTFIIILLIITIAYKPLEIVNHNLKNSKSILMNQLNNNHFCHCNKKCFCRDKYLKYMKEIKGIKLY